MKQCTELVAKIDCTITPPKGRKFQIKAGQNFLVTSPSYSNIAGCTVDRKTRAKANIGHYFTMEQIKEVFDVL